MSRVEATPVAPVAATPRLLGWLRREWPLVTWGAVWVVLVINFSALTLPSGDEQVQYTFTQRLYGDASHAVGYYFGLGLLEAPFYGMGKLVRAAGLGAVAGKPVGQTCIALAFGLGVAAAFPLLLSLLRAMRLRYPVAAIAAAALGTPLFYYASFVPGKNHAVDALLFTVVIWLTYRYFLSTRAAGWVPYALGAVLGLAVTVRYFSGAEGVALVLILSWFRRWRDAATVAVTAAATFGLLLLVPVAYGIPIFSSSYRPDDQVIFAPLNPIRMLVTDHRGMFVWSPVTVLALVGYVLLVVRRPEHRRFLAAVAGMAIGVMASYSLIAYWDGTWSFGQRYFTPLLPVIAIGLAGLIDAVPAFALAAAAVCVAWSFFLMLNLTVIGGPEYNSDTPGGAIRLARLPVRTHTSVGAYVWGVRHRSHLLP